MARTASSLDSGAYEGKAFRGSAFGPSILLNQAGRFLYTQGRYAEAEPLYVRALAIYEQRLGRTHPHTLTVAANYAFCLLKIGKTAGLEDLFRRFPELREQVLSGGS